MAYAEVFTALADPTRRHIFEALRERPRTVGELAAGQPVSRPAVSQHLRVLESARLVSIEPQGNRRLYLIRREGLDDLRRYLEGFWSDALTAYGAEIARRMEDKKDNQENTMLDPITRTIEVPCGQKKAFTVFVTEMGNWWPLDKRSMSLMQGGKPAKTVRVEAKLGGRIVEIGHDDTEHHWGTFKTYDPHDAISMDFHMGLPPESASLVEVRFTALGDDRTRVELTQSNWEGFGDMAEMMRSGYGSSWGLIFEEAYKEACGG